MRKLISILLSVMFICLFTTVAYAETSLKLSKTTGSQGESIVVSGIYTAESYVTVKVVDEQNNIVFLDTLKSDSSGNFSVKFIIPNDTTSKTLIVIAGSGNDVARATLQVAKPTPTPTPTPSQTPKKTPEQTTKPTQTAKPTQAPVHTTTPTRTPKATPTTSPAAQKTEAPTETPQSSAAPIETIKPNVIEENTEKGTITVKINTEDLPIGTKKIVLPGGKTIDVTNTKIITLEINTQELSKNGILTIIAIDDEGTPLGSFIVEVTDEYISIDAQKGWSAISSSLLWIFIAAVVTTVAIVIIYIITKKRKQE